MTDLQISEIASCLIRRNCVQMIPFEVRRIESMGEDDTDWIVDIERRLASARDAVRDAYMIKATPDESDEEAEARLERCILDLMRPMIEYYQPEHIPQERDP